jgi:hypothetical protein
LEREATESCLAISETDIAGNNHIFVSGTQNMLSGMYSITQFGYIDGIF